jgi:hypothetical protein
MCKSVSKQTRAELIYLLKNRYQNSSKKGKTRILDEFVAVSGYNRKYAIQILGNQIFNYKQTQFDNSSESYKGRWIYDEAVKEALLVIWEAADRICGKRLKAIMPEFISSMERYGHLRLDQDVKKRLLSVSAATIDRLLSPIRNKAKSGKRRRRDRKVSKKIPVRTFADWDEPKPGYFEIDFVVHCGGSMADSFIYTLVATDVCSGWTECIPLIV